MSQNLLSFCDYYMDGISGLFVYAAADVFPPVSYTHLDVYKRQLFNFCEEETEVSVSLEDLYASVSAVNEEGAKLTAEELWTGETAECKDGKVTGSVKAHGAKLYLLKKR